MRRLQKYLTRAQEYLTIVPSYVRYGALQICSMKVLQLDFKFELEAQVINLKESLFHPTSLFETKVESPMIARMLTCLL